jgi:hypothetical protein
VKRLALSLAASVAFLAAPAAVAHNVGAAKGYVSTLTQLDPPALGVYVQVRGQDDRLRLSNTTGKAVVVEGYDGEPYLRFTARGVYRNARSPATYLNADRWRRRRFRRRPIRRPTRSGSGSRPARRTSGTTTAFTG